MRRAWKLERDDGLSEQIPSHSNEASKRTPTCARPSANGVEEEL